MIDQAGEHNVTYEEFFNWLRGGERFENINDKLKFGKLCQAMEIIALFTVHFSHLHYNITERECEAI